MDEELDSLKPIKALNRRTSFSARNSGLKLNVSGLFARPLIRNVSTDQDPGMSDKLHSLMENYLAKDTESIQKQ